MSFKTLTFIYTYLCMVFLFTSCKKGDEDPEISFRSRKARLANNWKLKSGHMGITFYDSNNSIINDDYELTSSGATIHETPTSKIIYVYTLAYFLNLNISKDGTFTLEEQAGIDLLKAGGKWNFTGSIGDAKNKDGVIFTIDNVTSGATNKHLFNKFRTEFSYKIVELRNKEIKLKAGNKTYLDDKGNSTNYSGTLIFNE